TRHSSLVHTKSMLLVTVRILSGVKGETGGLSYIGSSESSGRISAAPSGISTPHVHKHFLFGTM
ncbi:hypothetical protein, partial [Salmonella enterica]|uniref:hypothetical protein n=1 Tax=Salmonella enterica TaxID=28901 RepID=UPI001E30BB58